MQTIDEAPSSLRRATGPRVLLAEDDADTRLVLSYVLRAAGYEVTTAEDGLHLMSLMTSCALDEAEPPDVIVADVRMPHFTGIEALNSVQRSALAAPMILITAFYDPKTLRLARQGGAYALLEKPIDPDRLLATLEELGAPPPSMPPSKVEPHD